MTNFLSKATNWNSEVTNWNYAATDKSKTPTTGNGTKKLLMKERQIRKNMIDINNISIDI
ncbi:MAG: hypothetical protein MUF15_27945 [Acidobacteria bacterium]|nr:hypothetical protein [Acidobacteriota bacterium]